MMEKALYHNGWMAGFCIDLRRYLKKRIAIINSKIILKLLGESYILKLLIKYKTHAFLLMLFNMLHCCVKGGRRGHRPQCKILLVFRL